MEQFLLNTGMGWNRYTTCGTIISKPF